VKRRTNLLEINSTNVGRDGLDEDLMRSGSRSDESLSRVVDDLAVLDGIERLVQGILPLLVWKKGETTRGREEKGQLEVETASALFFWLPPDESIEGEEPYSPSPQLSSPNA